jgi:hypothetical protein
MAKVENRIIAIRYGYVDGVITTTTLFFADGDDLELSGHVTIPFMETVEIRYNPDSKALNKVTLLTR